MVLVQIPSGPNPKTRIRIAFLCFFVFLIVLSVAAYFVTDLKRLQKLIAARESQAVLQSITDASQIEETLRQHPQNKSLQLIAMAIKTANETDASSEKLSNAVEPPGVARGLDLGAASRSDLEALARDLKTAQANATALAPRYASLLKSERDNVEKYALSLHMEKDPIGRFLDGLDRQRSEMMAFTSRVSAARADYYRAYADYVGILVAEFGSYKVADGQFIFPFQRSVDRYNVAAHAMTGAARRVAELTEEKKAVLKSQQEKRQQLVNGK
jgi:hypothetical protein